MKNIKMKSICGHLTLILGAFFMLLPFVIMLSTALKSQADIFSGGFSIIPGEWAALTNFGEVFDKQPIVRFMINGGIVTTSIFLIQVIIAVPCAYALAKFRFAGQNFVQCCTLEPANSAPGSGDPGFLELHSVGLLNSYAALILPWTISVLGIF